MSEIYDEGLLPPNVHPSRTDRRAVPEADTDDQLPGTDDGLHGEPGTDTDTDTTDGVAASDPLRVPAPEPEQVPERDPDIAPPTEPERAPAPEEDPEVAPLTDPEFDFRDPQRPEGTPI